ncbi:acyl-CoA dehydrogenase [Streptomyces sp. NPDC050422]|uniref:acyl-CoA dehydrogenase n=1 Tax=Streptomyces sp. NPDC050422 TaxID=3365614 RepID=UPI00379982D0
MRGEDGLLDRADLQDSWARADRLDLLLGDPGDPGNPAGLRALLAADRQGSRSDAAERVLDGFGLGAEFVPVADGGRLDRADGLAAVLGAVFRRDLALGFGHGMTSLFAATPVWAAGDARQRAEVAGILCGGGQIAIVHHALARGNALLRGEMRIRDDGTGHGFVLNGRKEAVLNAGRARMFTVYGRAGDATHGPGSLSVVLLDREGFAAGGARVLPRRPTTGLRGGHVGGLELDAHPVPDSVLVGQQGQGMRLALQTFQLSRALIPAALVAGADTVLRAAVGAALRGGLGPRQRGVITRAFAELLLCDSLTQCALRALHLQPHNAHLTSATTKYLVPELVRDTLEDLVTTLAPAGDLSAESARATEQLHKFLRDMAAAGLGAVGAATCQAVLVPQLPRLAARSWFTAVEPPRELFVAEQGLRLPSLDLGSLAVAGGDDILAAALVHGARRLLDRDGYGPYGPALRALVTAFVGELGRLRRRLGVLSPRGRPAAPGPAILSLSERYVLVAAAGAAVSTWQWRGGSGSAWLVVALRGLARRLGLPDLPELPPGAAGEVLEDAIARWRGGRAYDLRAGALPSLTAPERR